MAGHAATTTAPTQTVSAPAATSQPSPPRAAHGNRPKPS